MGERTAMEGGVEAGEQVRICRASLAQEAAAFRIVAEYNDAVGVQVRDTPEAFRASYFSEGGGLWLALVGEEIVGCIALRALPRMQPAARAAEVKRLYVRPAWRGRGIADALLDRLEAYASEYGVRTLYLDSKDDLQAALRFYRRRGYRPCARYNDNPQATVFLRKDLECKDLECKDLECRS
jgi:GNAT superfamily N-acetyltransferase